MKLIQILDLRKTKNSNRFYRYGLFYCEHCKNLVEKRLCHGLTQKSCGCVASKLKSEANKGEPSWNKGIPHSEEARKNISESKKGKPTWNKGIHISEEARQKISETRIKNGVAKGEKNPMFGIQRFGNKNPNWNNGTSFEPYAPEFNKEKKKQVLERDNYTCQCPDCEHISTKLDCHHIDYDKKNNSPENLITLCSSCHAKTNGKKNRIYWVEYYQNIMRSKNVF